MLVVQSRCAELADLSGSWLGLSAFPPAAIVRL
jgi:hypothetical protein